MPEDVSVDTDMSIIRVRSYGAVVASDMRDALEEVKRLSKLHRTCRVLVDVREQASRPSTADEFFFYSALPRELRIAIISSSDSQFKASEEFASNVTANRGIFYQVFEVEAEALDWLCQFPARADE